MWQGRKFPGSNTARGTCRTCVAAEQNGAQAHDAFCESSLPVFRRIPRDATPTGAGSPSGAAVKKNPPAMQETQGTPVRSLGREDPLEEEMQDTQYSCLEKSLRQRSLAATVHGVRKESDTAEHSTQHVSLTRA